MNNEMIRQWLRKPPSEGPIDLLKEKPLRVAVYQRVGAADIIQTTSTELTWVGWKEYIAQNRLWSFAGMYIDEGIENSDRDCLLDDCRAGKIDLILTKSLLRFFISLEEAVKVSSELAALNPPVGIFFESDGVYTLSREKYQALLMIAAFAEEESKRKPQGRSEPDGFTEREQG